MEKKASMRENLVLTSEGRGKDDDAPHHRRPSFSNKPIILEQFDEMRL